MSVVSEVQRFLATTRFTNVTLAENREYLKKLSDPTIKCIYGASERVSEIYPLNCILIVIEMNNDENRIEGIGIVRNFPHTDRYYKIYSDGNYNRYVYKGTRWIPRDSIDVVVRNTLEIILFKGRSHAKRLRGISVITSKLLSNWENVSAEQLTSDVVTAIAPKSKK